MRNFLEEVELPFFTANFDYFRLAPEKWELMLTRLVQLGIGGIVVTVPWGFHQPQAGHVDFAGSGTPRHDLITVLKLCTALKLVCLLKPGPFFPDAARLLNQGHPMWLNARPDMFEKAFAAAFSSWLHTFSEHTVEYQYPNGPVAALLLDFEASIAESEAVVSNHLKQVRWPIWLRKHYASIADLNAVYGSTFQNINDVAFPDRIPINIDTLPPLERDAQQFLYESRQDAASPVLTLLQDYGWQIPIAPFASELPPVQEFEPAQADEWPSSILNLPAPFSIDPDPHDVGTGPMWDAGGPIRLDGTFRRHSWPIRRAAWRHQWPAAETETNTLLVLPVENGGIILSGQDNEIKLPLPKETKPLAYRLLVSGGLTACGPVIRASRGKLRGHYYLADEAGDTDLIFFVSDPEQPLAAPLAHYLQKQLAARRATLAHWGKEAALLSEELSTTPEKRSPTTGSGYASSTLEEARRGLREAEAALKKAVLAIGSLSSGLETAVGKQSSDTVTAVSPAVPITAYAFEGETRKMLLAVAALGRNVVARIKPAANSLKSVSEAPTLTIVQYQQAHSAAVDSAVQARQLVLPMITDLREAMAAEQLPLVTWRVHQQLQAITSGLHWGVLSG
jgi:hypothetical protein